jgi:hypothetical protein
MFGNTPFGDIRPNDSFELASSGAQICNEMVKNQSIGRRISKMSLQSSILANTRSEISLNRFTFALLIIRLDLLVDWLATKGKFYIALR